MHPSSATGPSIAAFTLQFDQYLLRVRGSAESTRRLRRLVVHRFFTSRFPNGVITWSDLRFSDCAAFVRTEFARLPSHDTQKTWLMILRSLLRYLADDIGAIPRGWDAALPRSPIGGRRASRGTCPRPKCTISSARARRTRRDTCAIVRSR